MLIILFLSIFNLGFKNLSTFQKTLKTSMEMGDEEQETPMFPHLSYASFPINNANNTNGASASATSGCGYYVESPCCCRSSNTCCCCRDTCTETTPNDNLRHAHQVLSRYSSRGSNNSSVLLNHVHHPTSTPILSLSLSLSLTKDVTTTTAHAHADIDPAAEAPHNRLIIVDHHHHHPPLQEDDDDGRFQYHGWSSSSRAASATWWSFLSFRRSNSCGWICLQLSWRFLLSLAIALLVFYMSSKPQPPLISIKMAGIRQFSLGEGVDSTGVTTKMLTCNCSIDLIIDNKSKLFGLHVDPPVTQMSSARLPFASSYGRRLYAPTHDSSWFRLYVGTRNKPVYGAGRYMQDMLESGRGLPLIIRVSLRSNYRVVWDLIKPKFHHQAHCLVFLDSSYDETRRSQVYNSSCNTTPQSSS